MIRTFWFLFLTACVFAQEPALEPDDRFKADILLIVAHPDDEGMAVGYLAKAIFDQHKRVAVVYGTRGDGGENAVGLEQAAALGAVREIEARKAVATLGITNVWFLGAPDTYSQNVLRSLETWNHGSSLWQMVRLVRLTRPQVILTWMPAFSVGENHGDHQAASVLATEAFDMAADPTVFPEQVAAPLNRRSGSDLTEGLQPWQPQKLYFFSDTANPSALDGKGPQYPWDELSPSRHVTYGRLALESIANHRTQNYPGLLAERALKTNDMGPLKQMKTRLVLGKSLVPTSSLTADVFEGTTDSPIPFKRAHGYEPAAHHELSAELGGPWAFYQQFWPAHNLAIVPGVFAPQMSAAVSSEAVFPVLLHNDSAAPSTLELQVAAPSGWGSPKGNGQYALKSHESRMVTVSIPTPAQAKPAEKIHVHVTAQTGPVADLFLDVTVQNAN